jgi:hypothetical protein
MSDEASLKRINEAAVEISEALLAAGLQIATRAQQERGLTDFEIALATGNAYQQIMASAWSTLYDLDITHLAPQLMDFIKTYLKTAPKRKQ